MRLKKTEIENRLNLLISKMNKNHPGWGSVFILSDVNQYYFTGTMQDGFLLIKSSGHAVYYVYRSYERALAESEFPDIYPINSYRDSEKAAGRNCGKTFFETNEVPYSKIMRFLKYFDIDDIASVDKEMAMIRAVKSEYELACLKQAGEALHGFMTKILPNLIKEGISEAELYADIYSAIIKHGSQGISRFKNSRSDSCFGRVCFGESSVYPTKDDSPNGSYGMSASAPIIGSRERKLKKGDLIFIDLVYSIEGYHTDKSQVYINKEKPDAELIRYQNLCRDILEDALMLIKPGVLPSYVYNEVTASLNEDILCKFMGIGKEQVKFIGHGIGLNVDELPVIADKFDIPFEKNMTIAIEPKIAIPKRGMLGVEEDYIIEEETNLCLTGGASDIIQI